TFLIKYLEDKRIFDKSSSAYAFGDRQKISGKGDVPKPVQSIPFLTDVLPPESIKIAQRESLMWGTTQQEAIEYGNVVHEILSLVKTKNDVDKAMSVAIETGLIAASDRGKIEPTIWQVLGHVELKGFFAEENQVLNEKAIIRKESTAVKPDRIVLGGNSEVLLLDYKTGAHNAKYVQQMEIYQDALEKMGYRVA